MLPGINAGPYVHSVYVVKDLYVYLNCCGSADLFPAV